MNVLGTVLVLLATLDVCVAPTVVHAAGKRRESDVFRCVSANVTECDAEDECERVTPEKVNLPAILDVNLKGKTVRNEESGRQSPIRDVHRTNGRIVLQGSEGERSWTLTIREDSGKMWAAVTGDDEAFVISGVCAAP